MSPCRSLSTLFILHHLSRKARFSLLHAVLRLQPARGLRRYRRSLAAEAARSLEQVEFIYIMPGCR